MTTNLPIDAVLDEVRTTLLHSPNLLLIAEPGAGKTTRVPLALLDQPWLHGKRIIMLEPRRVAARNAALFMAAQLNENVGQRVGYRMRLEHKVSASTRIEVVTEGILTNMLQDDPALSNVGLVIFDEFHERHLASDLGLALCLQSQQLFNDQLRLLVMSATLDESALLTIMDAQVIRSPGRGFPITTFYRPAKDANERLTAHLSRVLSEALQNSEGDVLVFLPGTADIRHAQNHLASFHPNCVVLPLHGQLSDRDQKQALQPDTQQLRKIILSTNLAESALTIDGVSIVIDSGLERRLRFKPSAGLSELVTQGISCASATQREGRAGRQSPGTCYRLYSDTQLQQRPDHIRPEMSDADLAPLLLSLLQWGASADDMSWVTPPSSTSLQQAQKLLSDLGIIDSNQLTSLGKHCCELGLEPRLAAMILRGDDLGMGFDACCLAALLQEPGAMRAADDIERVFSYTKTQSLWSARIEPLARRWFNKVRDMRLSENASVIQTAKHADNALDIAFLLGCAFPDRIAKLRGQTKSQRYLLASGAGAELAQDSALCGQPWMVCCDVAIGQPNRIRTAVTLTEPSLERLCNTFKHLKSRHVDIRWLDNGQLLAEEQEKIGAVIYRAQKITQLTDADWDLAWRDQFVKQGVSLLNWTEDAKQLRQRIALAHKHDPVQWPDVSDETLITRYDDWLAPYITGLRHQRALAKVNVSEALMTLLPWSLQQTLNAILPTQMQVPSGSRIAIDYVAHPPVLAVKLQEMFGFEGQPSVLHGTLPLMLHLLSPARRPLQVTQDLPHFWRHSYHDVRKDMRGRYPKHPWPEDPLSAVATRFTKSKQPLTK